MIELYICYECKEEYSTFEDMFDCYKSHFKEGDLE